MSKKPKPPKVSPNYPPPPELLGRFISDVITCQTWVFLVALVGVFACVATLLALSS